MLKSYVGITGPTTKEEVANIWQEFLENRITMMHPTHMPMIGFLVSDKTLRRDPVTNPIYKNRYPKIERLPSLLREVKNAAFTTIHYNTKQPEKLSEQIKELFMPLYGQNLCKGLQLNVVWPEAKQVEEIKKTFPELKIILQASRSMLETIPDHFVDLLNHYTNNIDYLLLDSSGGLGKELNSDLLIPFYKEVKKRKHWLQIGFAGGLCGENLESKLKEISEELGNKKFSIDAEGKLRTKDDLIGKQEVHDYIAAAKKIFK